MTKNIKKIDDLIDLHHRTFGVKKEAKAKQAMSPRTFKDKMKKIAETDAHDKESIHGRMDDLMCELLADLGYKAGIDIFKKTDKWYG